MTSEYIVCVDISRSFLEVILQNLRLDFSFYSWLGFCPHKTPLPQHEENFKLII